MKKVIAILLVAMYLAVLIPSAVFADVSVDEYLEKNIIETWESNVWIQTSEAVKLRNMPCSEKTNSNSRVIVELPAGSYLMTTGIFQNDQRNLWYRVLYEGHTYYAYINYENFPANQIDWFNTGSMSFENLGVQETITQGETELAVTGIVKSPYSMLKRVSAYFKDSKGGTIPGTIRDERMYVNTYEFDLAGSELMKLMAPEELEAGDYYICFEAEMETGYVSSKPSLQEIKYFPSIIKSANIPFTVIEEHTCNYVPTTRLALHPHNYIGECSVCGDTKELEGTGYTGTKEIVLREATCTEDGTKALVCDYGIGKKKCETVIRTAKIEKLGHKPVNTITGTVCEVCGTVLSSTVKPHRHIYINTGETEAAHPHRSIEKCGTCGEIKYLDTENYNLIPDVTPSTCTVNGKMDMICDVCGEIESSTTLPLADHTLTLINQTETYSGDQFCTACEQIIHTGIELAPGSAHGCVFVQTTEKESAHPHRTIFRCACGEIKYGAENITPIAETTPSTCTESGVISYHCEACGIETDREILPLAEHTITLINQSGTYTGDKVCSVCEAVIEEGTEIKPEFILGDVNLDGKITAADATQILRYANSKSSCLTAEDAEKVAKSLLAADVDGNGKISASDATQILRYVNGKPSVLSK